MTKRTALDCIKNTIEGKIFGFVKEVLVGKLFRVGKEENSYAFLITGIDRKSILPIEVRNLTRPLPYEPCRLNCLSSFCPISPRDLTPDEAYNFAHYERKQGLGQTASTQIPPSYINHLS